jgi:hypothetical protein
MALLVPGVAISESAEAQQAIATGKLNAIILICTRTAAGTVPDNVPAKITSTTDLATKIGVVPAIVVGSVEVIRAVAPNVDLFVIAGKGTGSPTPAQNIGAGCQAVLRYPALPLGIILAPEAATFAAQADRTSVNQAIEATAATNGWDYLGFLNTGLDTDSKTKADAERALYASPQGNTALYFGFVKDGSNRDIPLAVHAAALAVQLNQNQDGFFSPAGGNAIVSGTIEPKYLLSYDDAIAVMNARSYNYVWQTNGGNRVWGDFTLATFESGWNFIPTRLSSSTTQQWLAEAIAEQQFQPLDPITSDGDGIRSRELVGRLTQVMERAKAEGALGVPEPVNGVSPPPYRIVSQPITAGKAAIEVRFFPVKSLREISIKLIATPAP